MNPRKHKNMSEKNGLAYKQHQAIAELLKPSNKSYGEVAKALGISSRCLYNWRKEPKFQETLKNGIDKLIERVLSAAEFSVQRDSVNSMLEYESKVIDAMDLREAVIKIMENHERLRAQLEAITEEVELLKDVVNKVWN